MNLSFLKQILNMNKNAPLLYNIVLTYLLLEFTVVVVFPFIVPETTYLSFYLSDKAQEKTRSFFENKNSLIPDEITGWVNRPGIKKKTWVIDNHGSRSTHDISFKKKKPLRVMFLGSSMINGGTNISNFQTISAYLEDKEIEAINFGTMMYSLDQVLLGLKSRYKKYESDYLIVGIDIEPKAGLKNHYIPFRYPEEENVPYIKPRFELTHDGLRLIETSPKELLSHVPYNNELIEFLSENDGYYFKFRSYKRFGLLPASSGFRYIYLKLMRLEKYLIDDPDSDSLLIALVNEINKEASQNGMKTVFLLNTDRTTLIRSGYHKYLKDLYAYNLKMLEDEGIQVVDVRQIFRDSKIRSSKLFAADESHYSADGNKLIAESLKKIINK